MKLSDCTKAELLWIIEQVKKHSIGNIDWSIQQALADLRFKKADEQAMIAYDARMKFIETMKPYDGWPMSDIPPSVLKTAAEWIKKSEKAGKQWDRLMRQQ